MAMRAAIDRVLVRRVGPDEEVSLGGIVIPDTWREKYQEAVVVAAGDKRLPGGKLVAMKVKPGDHVLLGLDAGHDFRYEGEDYSACFEEEILALIQGGN